MEVNTEQRARDMGWVPQTEFKGAADKWVDADAYVERGDQIMPLLRKNNERLSGDLANIRGELTRTQKILKDALESQEEFKKYHEEDKKAAVAHAIAKLTSDKAAAIKANDGDAVIEIEAAIDQIKEDAKPAVKPATIAAEIKKEDSANNTFADKKWWKDWSGENEWYNTDIERRIDMDAACNKLAARMKQGKEAPLQEKEFLDRAMELMSDSVLGTESKRSSPDKVEGSRGGLSQGSRSGRSYADLPADAKAACAKFADKLVGEGRTYKTLADWHKQYAADYFEDA